MSELGKKRVRPAQKRQRIKELYAELVQAYVNLINKEMEKTRKDLDQGIWPGPLLAKLFGRDFLDHSFSKENELGKKEHSYHPFLFLACLR